MQRVVSIALAIARACALHVWLVDMCRGVSRRQADKMVKNGASRPGTAMSTGSARSGFSWTSNNARRPGTARLTKDVKNILRASTPAALEVATAAHAIAKARERVTFEEKSPPVPLRHPPTQCAPAPLASSRIQICRRAQALRPVLYVENVLCGRHSSPSVSDSSTLSMGETVQMPVYSVAGKRHTLEELVYQKISQTIAGRSKATGRDMFRVRATSPHAGGDGGAPRDAKSSLGDAMGASRQAG
jgi:hypothetical protein